MIYVYAITEGTPSAPELAGVRGFGDAPLAARGTPDVSAVYAPLAATPRPTREAAVTHERVVEQLMTGRTILPARFGTVLRDAAALDEVLADNSERLAAGLDRVRGCVELGVRVMWSADFESPAAATDVAESRAAGGTGRAYLLARAAEERQRLRTEARAGELAANLNRLLLPCARDGVVRVLPTPQFVMAGAYLVPRESVTEFRTRVEEAGGTFNTLRLLCTGPWPPYHFVPDVTVPAVAPSEVRRG